jgi:nucleoside-diphosphate-sugar epimerase
VGNNEQINFNFGGIVMYLEHYNNVLVTGGSGFIGRHLVNALLSLNKKVVVLDNLSTALNNTMPQDVKVVQVDLRNAAQVMEAVKGTELIFHVAANASGSISISDPRFDFETNAVGTFNILEAALAAGTKRVVYVSSASVYGIPQIFPMNEQHITRPFVPYGSSKLMGELCCLSFCKSQGLSVAMVRPFCVYGPGENPKLALVEVSRYLRWHLNQRPIQVVGDMDRKTRDFVHVSDIVQGLLLVAEKAEAGEAYNLGSGKEISMRGLVEVIGSVTGRKPIVKEISEVTEDTYRLVGDISKIKALGYVPRMPLENGIARLVTALGKNPEMPGGVTTFKKGQEAEK